MSAAETPQALEAIGLLQFSDCTDVPKDAFCVRVAWPVTAWRVLVPAPRRTGSDPLQRAILRLIAAGCVDPHAISSWLDIPADLVRVLIGIYRSEGYIKPDEVTALSDRGQDLLKKDDEITFSDNSHHSAWILRDDWSGDIVPFLIEDDLRWCNREGRKAFTVLHGDRLCTDRPLPLRIREGLKEYRAYVNQVRDCKRTNDTADVSAMPFETEQQVEEGEDRSIPGIVQLLWERSERVYVPLWLYFTADDPRAWQIASGFSLPPIDGWFGSKLTWACGRIPELRQQVETWIAQAVESFPPHSTLDETDSRAVSEFPFLASHSELTATRSYLARAYRAEALFEQKAENLDVYIARCYVSLEALLTACLRQCRDLPRAVRILDEQAFAGKFGPQGVREGGQIERLCGTLNVSVPAGFRQRQYVEKARRVASGRGENLRDRAIALICHAIYDRTSPARSAFAADPEILTHLDTISRLRNHQEHYNELNSEGAEQAWAGQAGRSTGRIISVLGQAFFGNTTHGKQN